MDKPVKQSAPLKLERVEASELPLISGGVWDYSNRLGMLGQMLESRQDAKYGDLFGPTTFDKAAHRALEGWVGRRSRTMSTSSPVT